MKRIFILLLAIFLLVGCGKKTPPAATEPTASGEQDHGLYVPGSSVEQGTDGAVRPYKLPEDTYFGLAGIGGNVLAMGQKGLTLLTGPLAEGVTALETGELFAASVVDTHATGLAYYLPATRQVKVLNPQLQVASALTLPEAALGKPVISLAKYEIYYSTGSEIRALNINTGISRLLRQQTVANLTLVDTYFGGEVLLCQFANENGPPQLVYVSTETGQTLSSGLGISNLQTNGAEFFADWQDGTLLQSVYGIRGAESRSFSAPGIPEGKTGGRAVLLAMRGVVYYTETETGLELSYYNLSTGKHTAQVELPGLKSPARVCSDGTYVWLMMTEGEPTLYRWDISKSAITDETVYTGTLYTADKPDTQGLTQCRALADDYQKKYGVKLLLWQDAVAHADGHTLVAEHKPQVIEKMLKAAEPILAHFPEKFLLKTVEKGWLQIAFVQSIDGDKDWVQFWEEGDCWILISTKADTAKALIQGIAYGIDSHVIGNSRKYDTWNQLNPKGFSYSATNKAEDMQKYLEPATRAFADVLATTYPHEDRCRVFYHAMLPDNADMFASAIMQEKLLRVCTGIREAYGLEKKTDTYVWEQYLKTSLAYTQK